MTLPSFTLPDACLQRLGYTNFHHIAAKEHAEGPETYKYILLFIAARLASVNTVVAEKNILEKWQQGAFTHRILDSHYNMFDGVKLTDRQQLRDLMSLASRNTPRINIREMEHLHTLVTAKAFDEAAIREQTENGPGAGCSSG